jgi:hypothetical protein
MTVYEQANAKSAAISTAQQEAEKGQANGYCPLGADAKVPAANLPAGSGGGYIVGEVRWFVTAASIPAGGYLCDGTEHNGVTTPNLIGKYVRSASSAGGTGGSATHQHAAISAGTPAGAVSTIAATSTPGINATVSPGSGFAAQTHDHPAPTFTGSALDSHQHAAANGEPPYYELMPYEYCGIAE